MLYTGKITRIEAKYKDHFRIEITLFLLPSSSDGQKMLTSTMLYQTCPTGQFACVRN